MTHHRKPRSSMNANFRIPESITPEFIDRIAGIKQSLKSDYLHPAFLSKYVSSDTDPADVRKQRAIFKWMCAEQNNAATNDRLLLTNAAYNILPRVGFMEFVEWTRKLIETTIGATFPWDSLIGTFSGGASTSRNRTLSHPAGKYLGKAHATEPALEIFRSLLSEEMPLWASFGDDLSFDVVPGNVMFTVAKKADIDRCACKEPDINMFLQKGAGSYIRSCLRTVGINLNDQLKNRSLARVGSITGNLATLDLSSASDSVTRNLVELLLPECWFSTLDVIRSQVTYIDGVEHQNEMFSSMGNGFTFELESLLFWALARATAYFSGTSGVISVYGDDLIVPTRMAHDLIWVLGYFGFETNESKSFIEGPFRESCGGHYHNGFDVTPFYLRAPLERLTDLIHMANSLRKWSSVGMRILDPDAYETWHWLQGFVPEEFWGGRDLANKTRLVTPHEPRRFISQVTRQTSTGDGGYLHWSNITSNRTLSSVVETSTKSTEQPRWRSRAVRETVTSLQDQFYQELV